MSAAADQLEQEDLLAIARRVAGAAHAGEQVEAYVLRTQETDVEVFGGEVESLTTAGIQGVGVRVIVDHRQGYASAGSLEPDVIEETLREARDNAAFGEPDEWYALASPAEVNGVVPAALDLWREELVSTPTDAKVQIALDLEVATKARDSRVRGVEATGYGDARAESAIANSLGVEAYTRRTDVLGARGRTGRRRFGHADRIRLRRGPFARGSRPRRRSRATPSTARCASSARSRSRAGASRSCSTRS